MKMELTKAEEQVMQYLWQLEKGFVKEVLECYPDPRPAYNTVSTIIRILVKKGFVAYRELGSSYEYYPVVSREAYSGSYLNSMVNRFFGNSYAGLVSFFAADKQVSVEELEKIRRLVDEEIKKSKNKSHE
ncbi:MAG TPA: BlaI/MecI/CopY family transcriptional regulator [Bacteroidales bacterium]|nr:BlaI/MecI/CopY family transcriptional regulator [Bacteroidales bacterium]HRZ49028.1 BlaI/MecI/CopY family transcriptional regulator [Bacteroidales bacterium]